MALTGVAIRKFEVYSLPLEDEVVNGGRIMTPAGEIAQIVRDTPFCYLAYLEFQERPGVARGNHYHTEKYEYLYIIKGQLHAVFKDIDSNETEEMIVETGDLVEIAPRCAHVFYPLEYTMAVEFSPHPYDPTDLHRYEVEG
jgi:mannose-6-phosphate isomerase-like protein (cupin superfamily)